METALCVANVDTATALRVLTQRGLHPVGLNFANAHHAGGGYLRGARAQEEDLCRLMPTLYSALKRLDYPLAEDQAHYLLCPDLLWVRLTTARLTMARLTMPRLTMARLTMAVLAEEQAHYSHAWLARQPGTYRLLSVPVRVALIAAAMPNLGAASGARRAERELRPGSDAWRRTTEVRIRTVLDAALAHGHTSLVLGAFGCGAFGNPPADVAAAFARVARSAEFRGSFSLLAFAIVDPKATDAGNLVTFRDVLRRELSA